MRGSYEQQWQDALANANVQPSDFLWEKIASTMDNERGSRSWITILLVAATVTMAFALPMTIGNSELQNKEYLEQSIAKNDDHGYEVNTVKEADKNLLIKTKTLGSASDEFNGLVEINNNESSISKKAIAKTGNNVSYLMENNNKRIGNEEDLVSNGIAISGYSIRDITMNRVSPVDINDYYFIPFYVPKIQQNTRNLLASLNLGTGSLKAGKGGGLGLLSADEAFTNSAASSGPTDERVENTGSSFYFGTGVEIPLGKRWSFIAGVGYLAQNSTGKSNIVLDAGNSYQPLGAYDPVVPGTIFLSESYDYSVTNGYINVPLLIKYPLVNRKIKFRVGLGLSTDFMITHILNSESYGKASYKPSNMNYNNVVLAGLMNLDISYSLNNQYSLALETGIRKGFTPIDQNKKYYPSSFTIGLILFYKIH